MHELDRLTELARSHGALRNRFFAMWREAPLDASGLVRFLCEYRAWVEDFPASLAALLARQSTLEARVETARTLFSECGHGRPGKDHASLFTCFARESLSHSGADPAVLEDRRRPLLPSTEALLGTERELYRAGPLCRALGAQLALEWQAYEMVMQLYEGARLYRVRWPDEVSFHEACEYFHAHLGETEKDHRAESLRALESAASGPADVEAARQGVELHLRAIEAFWNGLADEIARR